MYVSAELVLIQWTAEAFTAARVTNEPPADLQEQLPVIVVSRYGGSDRELTIDRPWMDVDCYAATWAEADALSMAVLAAYRGDLPGALVTADDWRAVVASVTTITGPSRRPTTDSTIRRSGASYEVRIQSR